MTEHSPTPWKACHNGNCRCKQIWSKPADHPVVVVESGEWGDSYPDIRLVKGKTFLETRAEAYIEKMPYGEIPEEVAAANARFIVKACNLHEELVDIAERASGLVNMFELDDAISISANKKLLRLQEDCKGVLAKAQEDKK